MTRQKILDIKISSSEHNLNLKITYFNNTTLI